MKRHWLRGLLLGVSMALLLSGGVALGASLRLTVNRECAECWPGPPAPEEDYIIMLTLTGWVHNANYPLCTRLTLPLETGHTYCNPPPTEEPAYDGVLLPCELNDSAFAGPLGTEVVAADAVEDYYGRWTLEVWQKDESDAVIDSTQVSWLFAEDCFAAMFVPEPGTIMLLGSGLAGLAGYATLRWRARE